MSEFEVNPYASGIAQQKHVHSDVEAIRHEHLSHEASIKSIGLMYTIGGAFAMLVGPGYIFTGITMINSPIQAGLTMPIAFGAGFISLGVVVFLVGLANIVVANGLGKLAPWSKNSGAIVAGIGLLFFPVGTLINGYVLYLLLSKKSSTVFSPQYKDVILQTPHMRHKTSTVTWVVLAICVAFFGGVIFYAAISI